MVDCSYVPQRYEDDLKEPAIPRPYARGQCQFIYGSPEILLFSYSKWAE